MIVKRSSAQISKGGAVHLVRASMGRRAKSSSSIASPLLPLAKMRSAAAASASSIALLPLAMLAPPLAPAGLPPFAALRALALLMRSLLLLSLDGLGRRCRIVVNVIVPVERRQPPRNALH